MKAARGSPSRGWPTEPGFRRTRRSAVRTRFPAGRGRRRAGLLDGRPSGTWLWPTSMPVAGAWSAATSTLRRTRTPTPDRAGSRGRARPASGALRAGEGPQVVPARRSGPRVSSAPRGRPGELVQLDLSEHPQVVVADQADVGDARRRARSTLGRAVADQVAQAPDRIRPRVLHRREHASSAARFPWTSDMTATRIPVGGTIKGTNRAGRAPAGLMPSGVGTSTTCPASRPSAPS